MDRSVDPALDPEASDRGVLVWRLPAGTAGLSSASVGGGRSEPRWVVNIGVPSDYARTDLDANVAEVAARCALTGAGIGLLTAVPVERVRRARSGGVVVHATVGVSTPVWAADRGARIPDADRASPVGTINVVAQLPVTLDPGAAVNAVITATEAKTQALVEREVDGSGTASDAVVILWPTGGAIERFAGPRSQWGARLAAAVHEAVLAGLDVGS